VCSVTGCASDPEPVSLTFWQQSVEHYVWDQGNGDPNVLRDMSWDDVHKGFAVMSDPQPARSSDAIGLLLGHPLVGGTPSFVFLVAMVNRQQLQSLQPVALRVDAGKFEWIVGPSGRAAFDAYRHWGAPNRSADTPGPRGPPFPRPGDSFRLDIADGELLITHQPTGITWALNVPPSASRAPAPNLPPSPAILSRR
jgi:hypothetical protein